MTSQCIPASVPDVGSELLLPRVPQKATFDLLYSKVALYEAALRVYTKPLFFREKGLVRSHDGQTLYHFAQRGVRNLEQLHTLLSNHTFGFREGVELSFIRSNRRRTAYIFPWEDRITDQLLYQMLNKSFHPLLSPRSYAFRHRGYGIDGCQHQIAQSLRRSVQPLYIVKRDVSSYFSSVDQDILLTLLEQWVEKDDYLYELLRERVKFRVRTTSGDIIGGQGIPFGTAAACLLANIYLTPLDVAMTDVLHLTYFRYADDVLAFSPKWEAAQEAAECFSAMLAQLKLKSKPSHEIDIAFTPASSSGSRAKLQHLGLEFRADGTIGLPRVKLRKIRSLFRQAFEDAKRQVASLGDSEQRARLLISIARQVLEQGWRPIAIVDYYLKHIDDESQLVLLDRWLAEEVVARVSQKGHHKGNFRDLSFKTLRQMGLPSLRHRRRLLRHGGLKSSFFTLRSDWLLDSNSSRNINVRGPGGEGTVARS